MPFPTFATSHARNRPPSWAGAGSVCWKKVTKEFICSTRPFSVTKSRPRTCINAARPLVYVEYFDNIRFCCMLWKYIIVISSLYPSRIIRAPMATTATERTTELFPRSSFRFLSMGLVGEGGKLVNSFFFLIILLAIGVRATRAISRLLTQIDSGS